jgi:uncharacterized membrane protein
VLVALWVVNILLALFMLLAGATKLAQPKAALFAKGMTYVEDFSAGSVKATGAVEVIGALGLILPIATGIAFLLAPLAAVGVFVVMIGAIVVHVRRKETFVPPLVLALIAAASAILGFGLIAG